MSISVPVRIWEPLMLQVPLSPSSQSFPSYYTWPTHQIYQKLATATTSCSVSLFLVNQVKLNARGKKKQLNRKGFVSSFDAWYSVYDNSLFLTALNLKKNMRPIAVSAPSNPTFSRSIIHSIFAGLTTHFRNEFFNSYESFFVIVKFYLDSYESSRVKEQTENRQHCTRAQWDGFAFGRHLVKEIIVHVRWIGLPDLPILCSTIRDGL